MRKVNFLTMFAAAALMMGVTSCDKNETNDNGSQDLTNLVIRISNPPSSRAVEAPGTSTEGTIELDYSNSLIYVINSYDRVAHMEPLKPEAKTTGQELTEKVPADARVYIVANIPSAQKAAFELYANWTDIKNAESSITTQGNYKGAALANVGGVPKQIIVSTTVAGTASVNVHINPLISRMELAQVKGGSDGTGQITSFTVRGVYVDSYYSTFKYDGTVLSTESPYEQEQSTDFSGMLAAMYDEGSWAAGGSPLIAKPASGDVWAYNVVASGLPRFIIKLDNIKCILAGETAETDMTGTRYLTVTSYQGVTEFERGKIYRVGGNNGIEFGPDDLDPTPNGKDVDVTVTVTVEEWEIKDIEPIL